MTVRPLNRLGVVRQPQPGGVRRAVAREEQNFNRGAFIVSATDAAARLPPRPGVAVLSRTIPLFYIGRNKDGLWVAREADGRSGGIFLFRRAAFRFARRRSAPTGCATMLLDEPFELDVESQGSALVVGVAAAIRGLFGLRAPRR